MSISWMMPLSAMTSGVVMVAPPTVGAPSTTTTGSEPPPSVSTLVYLAMRAVSNGSRQHVVLQQCRQRGRVGEQCVDGRLAEGGERLVGRGEQRVAPARQRLGEAGRIDRGEQRGEVAGRGGDVDDAAELGGRGIGGSRGIGRGGGIGGRASVSAGASVAGVVSAGASVAGVVSTGASVAGGARGGVVVTAARGKGERGTRERQQQGGEREPWGNSS